MFIPSCSSPALKWSHATNSSEKLATALANPDISAIECDVLMGRVTSSHNSSQLLPILAHPPSDQSDLTVASLLSKVTSVDNDGNLHLDIVIKLDFKDIESLEPTLNILNDFNITDFHDRTILLNADILAGPGKRREKHISAARFISTCLMHIRSCKVNF